MPTENFCIFRSEKIKSTRTVDFRQAHNGRYHGPAFGEDEAVFKNIVVPGTPTMTHKGMKYSDYLKEVTQGKKIRKNAVVAYEAVLTFSHGAVKEADLQSWAKDNIQFLIDVYGKENLFDIKIHLSERTPHIHAVCSVFKDGRMNANGIIRGPRHLSELQDLYAERMAKYNLCRGKSKKITRRRHKKVKDWYAEGNSNQYRLQAYEQLFGTESDWNMDKLIEFKEAEAEIKKAEAEDLEELEQKDIER